MDEDFPSESLQTPCISDNVTADDFSHIQTPVNPTSEYDLHVFSPSFDTSGNAFADSSSSSLKTSNVPNQHVDKEFLVEENIMDMQLYETLQNHHNYSLKPGTAVSSFAEKSGNGNGGDFGLSPTLTGHMPSTQNSLNHGDDSEDQSIDISDPLKEICRSSSPLYVPPQSKSSTTASSSLPVYSPVSDVIIDNLKDKTDATLQTNSQKQKDTSWTEIQSRQKDNEHAVGGEILTQFNKARQEINSGSGKGANETKFSDTAKISAKSEAKDTKAVVIAEEKPAIADETTSDRAVQDKAMFSENLGLMPADNDIKNDKKRTTRKGVRTRKSFENATLKELTDNAPVTGHKHFPGLHRCGSCNKTFVTICKLHQHLQDHGNGGSYHYNHILKTAFPKCDSVCAFTQTGDKSLKFSPPKLKPFGKGIKFKSKPKELPNVEDSVVTKRRRGRPRKLIKDENTEPEGPQKKKVVCKLKMRTEDGGTTWQEVQNKEVKTENLPLETSVDDKIVSDKEGEEENNKISDKCLNELENDAPTIAEKEIESPTKTSRKRKMSVPRKIPHSSYVEGKKIVNSRSRPEYKIKCDFCPSEFQYTRGLMRHEQEKHADEMKHECDTCKQRFMREYNLERHKLCAHTTGKTKQLRQKRGVATWREKKKRGRKPLDRSPEDSITCEVCGKFVPASKAEIHLRLHTGERPFICHICGKGLISDKKLKRHLLIHSETKRHTCEVCGEGFAMKYKLRTHMFLHTGHKPYLCSVCGAEFNNSTTLLHHHRTVHLGDKRFECTVCGGRYGKKSQLDEHMFSHSSQRTQTCRYCGKTFKHAKSLRRHEFTHVSDQKFSCDQCDSKFSRKDNLERHKMCHYETSLQCKFCKKKFLERKPLLEHEQFHINQRKFQCQMCKDKFQDETYFYNHMEKQHDMTRKMVDAMNENREKEERDITDKDLLTHSIILETSTDQLDQPGTITIAQDTLNFSMNVAGIIPSSGQDLIPCTSASLHAVAQLQNNGSQALNAGHNIIITNGTRILNQPATTNFATASHIIPGLHESQRATFNTISTSDNGTIRIPLDQQATPLALTTSDNLMIHEQQRLMQEALGSTLNMQNSGFRMQNLY